MKIFVTAKTQSREDRVLKIDETHFEIRTKELPISNRANLAIFELLAEYFNIPKTDIQICHGLKSKQKIFEINL